MATYAFDTFDESKYSISNLAYPMDLMSAQYGGNYVVFNISVSSDSKFMKGDSKWEVATDQPSRNDRGEYVKEGLSAGKAVLGAVTGTAIAGAGGVGALTGDAGKSLAGGAAAAAPGAIGLGLAASQASSMSRTQQTLKAAIALHVPNQLQIRYGTQWAEEDTSTAVMAPLLGDAAMKALIGGAGGAALGAVAGRFVLGKGGAGIGAKIGGGVGAAAGAISDPRAREAGAALGLAYGPNAGAISAGTGLAFNPRKEQVFKGVDFRTFQMDYQFFPRDADESANVLSIIKQFKLHMHPEYKDVNKFMWLYPSEFDITYYNGNGRNTAIHRHTSCVLTELSINYTPNGNFNTFFDGTPTQINMQLTFKELALMDKDRINDGF